MLASNLIILDIHSMLTAGRMRTIWMDGWRAGHGSTRPARVDPTRAGPCGSGQKAGPARVERPARVSFFVLPEALTRLRKPKIEGHWRPFFSKLEDIRGQNMKNLKKWCLQPVSLETSYTVIAQKPRKSKKYF